MTPHDLAAAYALDALDPDDLEAFTRHLTKCASCVDEVLSLREVAATLGASAALSGSASLGPAPASLRDAVLAGVGAARQVSAGADVSGAVPAAEAPTRMAMERAVVPRVPSHLTWIGAAAAAIVALALGVGVGGFLARDVDDPALAAHEQAMRIISAPDAHAMSVPLGRSSLVMSEDYAGAVLMGDTTPMPAAGTEYQLWMGHADGTAAPGPTFMPNADGTYMVLLAGDMGDVSKVFVTTEPAGGSEIPSGPMVAETKLGAQTETQSDTNHTTRRAESGMRV